MKPTQHCTPDWTGVAGRSPVSQTLVWAALLACPILSACSATTPDRAERIPRGYVYYLDGAGGGGITNWSGGVRDGLLSGGYTGAAEMFSWETGRGVLADQTASNEYKRGKARKLAQEMAEYRRSYPQAPITLIGLSAGTAIAVFALEELPADLMVENVILLSGSLSSTHDLTKALRHVNGKVYISTSQRDVVLGRLLPAAGTADRGSGTTDTIGVEGPRLPVRASPATRQLYAAKLVVMPWRSEFARYGNHGGHTDTVSAAFIERYVAPLVEARPEAEVSAASASRAGELVENPDYPRWARFPTGSWALFEGQQLVDGQKRPFRLKTTLVNKTASVVVLRREQIGDAEELEPALRNQTVYESAHIAPQEHPLTDPAARIEALPDAEIRVGSREYACTVKSVSSPGDFTDWGSQPQATVHASRDVPGGIVQMQIKTRFDGKPLELWARLVEFHVAGAPRRTE